MHLAQSPDARDCTERHGENHDVRRNAESIADSLDDVEEVLGQCDLGQAVEDGGIRSTFESEVASVSTIGGNVLRIKRNQNLPKR